MGTCNSPKPPPSLGVWPTGVSVLWDLGPDPHLLKAPEPCLFLWAPSVGLLTLSCTLETPGELSHGSGPGPTLVGSRMFQSCPAGSGRPALWCPARLPVSPGFQPSHGSAEGWKEQRGSSFASGVSNVLGVQGRRPWLEEQRKKHVHQDAPSTQI